MKILKVIKTQSIIEYAVLILIVSMGVGAMTFYISRALNVKARHLAQELNEANR